MEKRPSLQRYRQKRDQYKRKREVYNKIYKERDLHNVGKEKAIKSETKTFTTDMPLL